MLDRYLPAVEQIRSQHRSGVVIAVSHGGVIRIAALELAANVTPAMAIEGALPNTGQVVFVASTATDGPAWHCIEWSGVSLGSFDRPTP